MADTAQVGYLAVAKQSAMGTPNTADLATQQVLHDSHKIGGNVDVNDPKPEIGGGRDPRVGAATFGGFDVSGDLDAALRFALLPYWLLGAGFVESGSPTADPDGAGGYRHRFVYGDAAWLTLESQWGAGRIVRRWQDVLVDTLDLSVDAGGDGKLSVGVLGLSESTPASPTIVSTPASDGKCSGNASAATFDGLSTYKFSTMKASLKNNLDDGGWVIGSRTLGDITPGEREFVVSGTVRLGNNNPSVTDLYRAGQYGTKAATGPTLADPYLTSGAFTFGSTKLIGTSLVSTYRAVVTTPSLVLKSFPLEQSGADVLSADIEARAYGSAVTIDVYNARSTAY